MGRRKNVSTTQPVMLSVADVADLLSVSRQTVYNLIYHSNLPSVLIGGTLRRIPREDFDAWLKQQAAS